MPDVAMSCYPRKVRIVGGCFAGGLVTLVIIGWVNLPDHLQAQFTPAQLITLLAVLLAIVTAIGALALSTVRADENGLLVRNGFRTHRVRWQQVRRISFRDGDPWAVAMLDDAEEDVRRLGLLGIQRSDGRRAFDAVAQLRRIFATATDRSGDNRGR